MEPLLEFLHTGKTKRRVWDAADSILHLISDRSSRAHVER